MKRICMILLLGLCVFGESYAQPKSSAEADTMKVFRNLAEATGYEGKKLSVVSEYFKKRNTKIRYFSIEGTSPWIDPNGRCYLERVQVGYLTPDELDNRVSNEQRWILILDITLSPPYTVNITSLEKKYPLEDERIDAATRLAMIQDKFTIKTIKCWYIRPMK